MRKQQLAQTIKNAIKEKGLSNKQFAYMVDVQPSIVTRWLSGRHNFTLKTIFDIEWVLNIQLIDLN